MKNFNKITMLFVSFLLLTVSCNAKVEASNSDNTPTAKSIYDFTMNDIDGKVVVIVNTASECGLVAQLGEIEAFSKKYADKGVVVLGFPANNFLGQEPLENKDIKTFCSKNYGVTFQLFEKISVKGGNIAPLYKYLTDKEENGVIDAPVKWNYQKFIIGKDGKVVCRV